MPSEPRKVSEATQETLGSLRACLVEGDAEQRHRESRLRRRALVISILTQCAALVALVLVPLLGKTERIALAKDYVPIPPYGHPAHHATSHGAREPNHPTGFGHRLNFPAPTNRPPTPSNGEEDAAGAPDIDGAGNGQEVGPACAWCVNTGDRNSGPRPPQPVMETPSKPRVVHVTTLDPAMLTQRVEPLYPQLAKQIHREGRVELHAIIGTDGSIQSLEVISGDPMFYHSAMEAVRQWHYKPTILNGQPVEVDTRITVIYTMQH